MRPSAQASCHEFFASSQTRLAQIIKASPPMIFLPPFSCLRAFAGMKRRVLEAVLLLVFLSLLGQPASALAADRPTPTPVKVIFDTDIGNDVDDVLALCLLHALQGRGECEILAVTITKPDELAGPFVDAINHFYGRPNIPIGFTHARLSNDASKFLQLADATDAGKPRYPHRLKRSSDAPEATQLLRQVLARQPDASVVMVQVGYFSNLAALLDTLGDAASPLAGRELVRAKVKLLSVMAGGFETNSHQLEFNVVQDLPASRHLAKDWPTPIVWSGFEIGLALPYPAISIERDFAYVPHHPAAEAYCLYNPPPHERPTWDLTSALYAVLGDRGYFGLSQPGSVTVEPDGYTRFTLAAQGRDRYLTLTPLQAARAKEALVQLASQPPSAEGLKR
jgi:Inosine-uridine preferring nucleoside hydrolase